MYNTNITQKLLKEDENECESLFDVYDMLEKADCERRSLSLMKSKVSLCYLHKDVPWMKLWDLARDHGAHGSRAIQAVIKVLTTPTFSDWKCQICNATVPKDSHYAVHVAESHLSMTVEE